MTPIEESKLSSFDLRLAQWDEARVAGDTPPAGESTSPSRWQAAQRVLEQLDDMFGRSRAPFPQNGAIDGEVRLGRFVLLREIGRGGFGVVYLAEDPELGRQVALKIPRPELLLDEAGRQRLLHEGRAAATLNHPNLVAVFEAGEIGPVVYIAMAYCPGPSLSEWLKREPEPISLRDAAALVAALADAMQHAHSRGVLHRDLKPGNILLFTDSTDDTDWKMSGSESVKSVQTVDRLSPKIVDFGLARRIDDPSITQTGMILGTPAYMAPEQASGDSRGVGTHTDIYALGAILYELLTGRPPYHGAGADVIFRIQQDDPRPPRQLRPSIPRDLETICLKCLAREPQRRYSTAGALADDLHHWLAGEPIATRQASLAHRAWLWAKRKPALASALALLVLAIVGGISGTVWGLIQAREQLAQREAADRVDLRLTEAFACLAKGQFRQAIEISESCAAIMEDLCRRSPGSPWYQWHLAACYDAMGEAWRGLGELERAAGCLERSCALHRQFLAVVPNSINVTRTYIHSLELLTATYFLIPDSDKEVADLMTTRNDLHRRCLRSNCWQRDAVNRMATNLEELGDYYLVQWKPAEAAAHYAQARSVLAEHLPSTQVPNRAAVLNQRIDLALRLLDGDGDAITDVITILNSAELLVLLQRHFQAQRDYESVAATSRQIAMRFDGYLATWSAALGFAWAAEAAPPGNFRLQCDRRCEECLARLLRYSEDTAESVRSEPRFARYWPKLDRSR